MTVIGDAGCCANDRQPELDVLTELGAEEVTPDIAAARSAGFRLLLKVGRPVERDEWERAAGVEPAVTSALVDQALPMGRIRLDPVGRLVGIAGLSVVPTRHRIEIEDRTRWTWCALDAVGILGALKANGRVLSTDPLDGAPIEIEFRHGVPRTEAAMFVMGSIAGVNAVEAWCPNVNFFSDESAARTWAAGAGLAGEVVEVSDVAAAAAETWKRVVSAASGGGCGC